MVLEPEKNEQSICGGIVSVKSHSQSGVRKAKFLWTKFQSTALEIIIIIFIF